MDAEAHARSVRQLVHEFNNQLFVIGGHCELIALQLEPGSRAHADLAAILDATERASEIATRMRELAAALGSTALGKTAHAEACAQADSADVDPH